MKKIFYQAFLLLAGSALLLSCDKQDIVKKDLIDNKGLTACTDGSNCQYLFTEQADLVMPGYNFASGGYRLFWNRKEVSAGTQTLYIKAPMQGDSFELGKADIEAGKVVYLHVCMSCDLVAMVPADGSIKGVKIGPGNRADQTNWLIEAKVILKPLYLNNSSMRDTVYIKQYFTPNFVFN